MLQNCSVPFTRLLNSLTADSVTPEPIGMTSQHVDDLIHSAGPQVTFQLLSQHPCLRRIFSQRDTGG